MNFFGSLSLPPSEAWIPDVETDALAKEEVISHLKIWVDCTYGHTAQNRRARKYLDLCIDKICQRSLYGSPLNLINKYRNQVSHALERDELNREIDVLKFRQSVVEKIHSYRQIDQTLAQQKNESQLKETVELLKWEHCALESIHSAGIAPPLEKFFPQSEVDEQLKIGNDRLLELQNEKKLLKEAIQNEKRIFCQKEGELSSLEIKTDEHFKKTLEKEKALQNDRLFCLKKIKELQEEVDQEIEFIKLEPNRLSKDFETLNSGFKASMKGIDENVQIQIGALIAEQKVARKTMKVDYDAKFSAENNDFIEKKGEIQKRYNCLGQENHDSFKRRLAVLYEKFNKETILNRVDFEKLWNKICQDERNVEADAFFCRDQPSSSTSQKPSNSTTHQGGGGSNSSSAGGAGYHSSSSLNRLDNLTDEDLLVKEIFRKRDDAIQSQKTKRSEYLNVLQNDYFINAQYQKFKDKYKEQEAAEANKSQQFEKDKKILNKKIEEKLKCLLGRKK